MTMRMRRRIDGRRRTAAAHDHPHGRALTAFDVHHHLTALAAGIAFARRRVGGDGERLDRIVGKVGLDVEEQRAFGAQPRGEDFALEISGVEHLAAGKACSRTHTEFRVGRMGAARGALGLGHKCPVGFRQLGRRGVMLVIVREFRLHRHLLLKSGGKVCKDNTIFSNNSPTDSVFQCSHSETSDRLFERKGCENRAVNLYVADGQRQQ